VGEIGKPPNMGGIRGKNTKPELLIRKLLHRLGFRFRIHYQKLPGKPDIVLGKHKAIILVNGCFWHSHDCHIYASPKSRQDFWRKKLHGNQVRDKSYNFVYRNNGWKTLTVWECAIFGKTKIPIAEMSRSLESWILYDPSDAEITGREFKYE
jgi:DNA mismatch endonuclease (patch repair protein)